MIIGKQLTECLDGKFWNFCQNFRLMIFFYVLASILRFTAASDAFKGLDQDALNPGKGAEYYLGAQKTKPQTLTDPDTAVEEGVDLLPLNCLKKTTEKCLQQNRIFQIPSFEYTAESTIACDLSYPYRKYDGTCLNPEISQLGMANDCYFRFTPQSYDGYGDFRKSVEGGDLPEPRNISLRIFKDRERLQMNVSFQFLAFGQLIAHDMSRAVQPQTNCCSPANAKKEECKPIKVRPDDPFYSKCNKTCIDFQRTDECPLGTTLTREQKNGATAALDCSILYGEGEDKVKRLRASDGTGKLNSTQPNNLNLLPTGIDPDDIFCPKKYQSKCFITGDPRVNQHSLLTSMLTVWMREHNRIAEELTNLNPHWDEEKLFQETRKIVIAELQFITYYYFLPIILTTRIMKDFDITIKEGPDGTLFNPGAVLATWHDWAHAAFRLHSSVPSDIGSLNLRFQDTYSNPNLIWERRIPDLLKGSQRVPNEKFDRYMVPDLSNNLYKQPGETCGKDLAAINIQRGRDHGMAPYVETIKFCSEKTIEINSFDDLEKFKIIPEKNVKLLKELYKSVKDVDMWVGMQLENHMEGSIVGPSAVCITAKQFYFTQKGDRLFFNHEGLLPPFTADQRSAIKNTSWGRIVCDNTKIKQVQKNTFLLPSADNPVVSCDELPKVDLSFWKETESGLDI